MTPSEVRGPGRRPAPDDPPTRAGTVPRRLPVLAITAFLLAACSGGTSSPAAPATPGTAAALPTASVQSGTGAPGQPAASPGVVAGDVIPPGRKIADGSGGPATYTFREEWRTALVQAQAWRGDAYLVSAVGDMVNDDGIPGHWALVFVDAPKAQDILMLEIDPWGVISLSREITGDDAASFVDASALRIPYGVIDSDTAVGIGKAALAQQIDLATTRDPRIALGFSMVDGGGSFGTYTVFRRSTAEYVAARVDALTGTVISVK